MRDEEWIREEVKRQQEKAEAVITGLLGELRGRVEQWEKKVSEVAERAERTEAKVQELEKQMEEMSNRTTKVEGEMEVMKYHIHLLVETVGKLAVAGEEGTLVDKMAASAWEVMPQSELVAEGERVRYKVEWGKQIEVRNQLMVGTKLQAQQLEKEAGLTEEEVHKVTEYNTQGDSC